MAHVLMQHKVTGHTARIAASAVGHARTRGWTDPQDVPEPVQDDPAPEPESPAQEPVTSGWIKE